MNPSGIGVVFLALFWRFVTVMSCCMQDPPFGIHLCGTGKTCVLQEPVVPVHDERVRPYRAIPLFHPSTIVQHYLRPEEMRPFYQQVGGQ